MIEVMQRLYNNILRNYLWIVRYAPGMRRSVNKEWCPIDGSKTVASSMKIGISMEDSLRYFGKRKNLD